MFENKEEKSKKEGKTYIFNFGTVNRESVTVEYLQNSTGDVLAEKKKPVFKYL